MKWRRHRRYVNGYWIGQYELPVQEALARMLRTGDTFYDVGANAGFYSLIASELVGAEGHVVSFDPDPTNCRSASEQIELNALKNWTIVQKAVGNTAGVSTFSSGYDGDLLGHLGEPTTGEQRSIRVQVTTLDEAIEMYPKPDTIKMDIEGAEVQALEGARRLLGEVRPTWLIESHGMEQAAGVRSVLSAADYRFYDLTERPVASGSALPRHVVARPG